MANPAPLAAEERDYLLGRADEAVAKRGKIVSGALFQGGALLLAIGLADLALVRVWAIAAICGGLGGALALAGWIARRRNAPGKLRPVADALRGHPETITRITHFQAERRRLNGKRYHVIEVCAGRDSLTIDAPDDHLRLLRALERLCPKAQRFV